MKRFDCRVQVGEEFITLVQRGHDRNEVKARLLDKYKNIDKVIDVSDRMSIREYDGSYVGSSCNTLA